MCVWRERKGRGEEEGEGRGGGERGKEDGKVKVRRKIEDRNILRLRSSLQTQAGGQTQERRF